MSIKWVDKHKSLCDNSTMKAKLLLILDYSFLILLTFFIWIAPKISLKIMKRMAKIPDKHRTI
jgi:hypothetical protein